MKRASEELSGAFSQINNINANIKKYLKHTLDFQQAAKKSLKKTIAALQPIVTGELRAHPFIVQTDMLMTKMKDSCLEMHHLLKDEYIPKTKEKSDEANSKFSEVNNDFKRVQQALNSHFDDFVSSTKRGKMMSAAASLDLGFENHCNILRYLNKVNEEETCILTIFDNYVTSVTAFSDFMHEMWKKMNDCTVSVFHMKEPQTDPELPNFLSQVQSVKALIISTVDLYREPRLPIQVERTSTLKPVTASRGKVIIPYTKENDQEVSAEEGEIVEIIDPTYCEYWKIKLSSGTTGFFPTKNLQLYILTNRPTTTATPE